MLRLLRKKKNEIKLSCVAIIIFLAFSMTIFSQLHTYASTIVGNSSASKHKILILNSYHKGFTWTDNQTTGIISTLKKYGIDTNISVEYLDWKRYSTEENLKNNYESLKYKYSNLKIDLIFTTDDAALEFALKNRNEIFSNAPIVFTGVNKDGIAKLTEGYSNFTGISEDIDPKNTVDLSLKILPQLKNIYLVYDNTESGKSTGALVSRTIKSNFSNINVIDLNNYAYNDIIKLSTTLDKDSIFLLTTYYVSTDNLFIDFEEFNRLLYKSSTVPIFHVYDFGIGNGSIGGSMINAKDQGEKAAKLGYEILNGKAASSIKIINQEGQREVLDYSLFKKYNVDIKNVPSNVEIINKPFSFYETYKSLVYRVLAILVFLLILIILLVFYSSKMLRMKKSLEKNNEELTSIYEELAATDEELKAQYDELMETRDNLMISQERYMLVLDSTIVGIWDLDLKTNVVFFSDIWYEMIGYEKQQFNNSYDNWEELIFPEDLPAFKEARNYHMVHKTKYFESDFRLKHKDGHYIWIHSRGIALFDKFGDPYRMTGSHMDISNIKKYQTLLQENAYHDALTGLYNRLFLYENIGLRIEALKNSGQIEAILFIDIDNFKFINDSMGHYIGDKLLIQIAKRLSLLSDNDSSIFRLSGDEFILYLKAAVSNEHTEAQIRSIIKSFQEPFIIDDNMINISVSIGVSMFPTDGDNLELLLRNADMAMYKAKENGRNGYCFYSDLNNEKIIARANIVRYLKSAIINNEFQLYYQPQINFKENSIYGFEALIRWISPSLGFVSPADFISIAEETGIIVNLGQWVLKNACSYIKKLNSIQNQNYKIAVNISVIQLLQDNFLDVVFNVLKETMLDPSLLELEITESIILDSPELILNKINKLREYNIGIALDDFGTGYSSLAYLRNISFTTLKIDKLFIDDIASADSDHSLTDTIISLGHKLGLSIVAEGVETKEQLKYLEYNNCDIIQGYLFSKPLPPSALESFIEGWNKN